MIYQIKSEQLLILLRSQRVPAGILVACAAYEEYREQYGYVAEAARLAAIGEVLDGPSIPEELGGMRAERELLADGVDPTSSRGDTRLEPSHTVVSEVRS